jgi:heme oxygenase
MTTSISQLLREAVLPTHRRIESLPFFAALTGRVLPVERYVDQLRAMAIVTTTLERAVAAAQDPAVRALRSVATGRAGLLLDDLAFFDGRGPLPDDPAPTSAAIALASEITLASAETPVRLLGHLYVSQGMAIGNIVHREDAKACAGGSAGGAKWYAGYGDETGPRFRTFCGALDTLALDEEALREAAGAAASAIAGLEKIHAVLDPAVLPCRRFLATTYNAEAGAHNVPAGAVETTAAHRAGERCLEEFPYFMERWGERGRRYTRSDVGWLTSLATLSPDEGIQQIRWFAGVLARRGMPSLLLERQLLLLREEMAVADPSSRWSLLGEAARDLSARRLGVLPEAAAESLAAAFVASAGSGTETERLRVARLLLSAVADESTGIPGTVEAITAWYRDARFPASWTSAVDVLVQDAFSTTRRAARAV